MWPYLISGRFWAEEGKFFYPAMNGVSFTQAASFLFHGHLELLTNLVIYISTFVSFKHAPLVCVYLSYILQSISVMLLIFERQRINLDLFPLCLFMIYMTSLPQSAEVWANAVNLHFHFAIIAALIAALPTPKGLAKHVYRALLLCSGLSGVPANFVVPIYLTLAFIEKDTERCIQAGIIALTAILQIALIFTHPTMMHQRHPLAEPQVIWLAIIAQQMLSPIFGFEWGSKLISTLAQSLECKPVAIALLVSCSLLLIWFFRKTFASKNRQAIVLFASALMLSLLSVMFGAGNKIEFISVNACGRYFFAGNCLYMLAILCLLSTHYERKAVWGLGLLLAWLWSSHVMPDMLGPPWSEAYRGAVIDNSPIVRIWPEGWEMPNFSRRLDIQE
jgi:hypothetical protein